MYRILVAVACAAALLLPGTGADAAVAPEPTFSGYLINQQSGQCLTRISQRHVHVYLLMQPCVYDQTQVFTQRPTTVKGGLFEFVDYVGTCLRDPDLSRAPYCTDGPDPEQEWSVAAVSPGVYRLTNHLSGHVLAISDDPADPAPGTNYPGYDDASVHWQLLPKDAI
ncbi:RICIN domain-containing protein [Cryptosporangium phraense]|uniref:RICIN domain-containing protein n=1 Tax=Cryptosporangium phraense TaxID=2593070 RepID=A0A545AGN6_9ACTN|nr:RICIN domain-containing protein [Cryptosporangium phraense]TQS40496.1 RICIN domain-containing protein [Cryptosporangium phraense]